MKAWLILGLFWHGWGFLQAQAPLPAANRLHALGMDLPVGTSAFAARSFPQAKQSETGWALGVSLHHYGEVEGLNVRQLALHRQKSRFHQAFFFDDWGDALYREQHYRLHTGLFLGKWQFGVGMQATHIQIAEQNRTTLNGSLGLSSRINANWQAHVALQQLYQPLLADDAERLQPPSQSLLALQYQRDKCQLFVTYRQQLGVGGDFGLGFLYQPMEAWQFDFAWSTFYRRMSVGTHYPYQKMRIHLGIMYQLLPGPWWNSGIEGGWP